MLSPLSLIIDHAKIPVNVLKIILFNQQKSILIFFPKENIIDNKKNIGAGEWEGRYGGAGKKMACRADGRKQYFRRGCCGCLRDSLRKSLCWDREVFGCG